MLSEFLDFPVSYQSHRGDLRFEVVVLEQVLQWCDDLKFGSITIGQVIQKGGAWRIKLKNHLHFLVSTSSDQASSKSHSSLPFGFPGKQ